MSRDSPPNRLRDTSKAHRPPNSFIGVQETVLLVNHALARGTPVIFVIFVVSRGSSSKALVLLVRMQIRHFRHFRQNPPFSGGTNERFTKSTVFGTPTLCVLCLSVFLLPNHVFCVYWFFCPQICHNSKKYTGIWLGLLLSVGPDLSL